MKKDEILEKSRKENKGVDEVEQFTFAYAGKYAILIGMFVCCLVAFLKLIFTGENSNEIWIVFLSLLGSIFTIKYVKFHRIHELLFAILFDGLFVFYFILFVIRLVG